MIVGESFIFFLIFWCKFRAIKIAEKIAFNKLLRFRSEFQQENLGWKFNLSAKFIFQTVHLLCIFFEPLRIKMINPSLNNIPLERNINVFEQNIHIFLSIKAQQKQKKIEKKMFEICCFVNQKRSQTEQHTHIIFIIK